MNARATIVCCLLLLGVTFDARSADVTTYGTGLIPCATYLDARAKESSAEVVPFSDWLVGYFSGANATSNRHNNILGPSDINTAMVRLNADLPSQALGAVRRGGGHLDVRRRLCGGRPFRRGDPVRLWIQALPILYRSAGPPGHR